jgi:hypothetical protein
MNVSKMKTCSSIPDSHSSVTTDWHTLRETFTEEYHDIGITTAALETKTQEEISVIHSILWTQQQILEHGLALSSVVISDEYKDFELHEALSFCQNHLADVVSCTSPTVLDFAESNNTKSIKHTLMFDWSFLLFLTATLKMPIDPTLAAGNSNGMLLHVEQPMNQPDTDASRQQFEQTTLAHIRDVLGLDLRLFSDHIACAFLKHLLHIGIFERTDRGHNIPDATGSRAVICTFPVPVGLDLSPDVEILFSAVESCLSDIDLSINEIGLLLLIRKLRPNRLATDYALRRSAKALVAWILAEVSLVHSFIVLVPTEEQKDESLAAVLRDYVAKSKLLPGLRQGAASHLWPSPLSNRPTAVNSAKNGGDYIACRRTILHRYAVVWMLELHQDHSDCYGRLLFEICEDVSQEQYLTRTEATADVNEV